MAQAPERLDPKVRSWSERKQGWLSDYRTRRPETNQDAGSAPKEAENEYSVFYIPIRCPNKKCQSKDVKCHTSSPPIRYHFCRKCGLRFKSVEK